MGSEGNSAPAYLMWHTHWDRAWYLSFEAYQHRLIAVLERIVNYLETGKIPRFSLDGQTALLADAQAVYPDVMTRLGPFIQNGQVHVGPWFTMPDTTLVSLESLLRNLQTGMADAHALGCHEFTAYLPDTFGQPESIPMLFRKLGIRHGMMWRGRRLTEEEDAPLFQWLAPNGDKLLTYQLPEGYFQMPLQEVELPLLEAKRNALNDLHQRIEAWKLPVFLPLGGDHLAPPDASILEGVEDLLRTYKVLHPAEFMAILETTIPPDALEHRRGELRDFGAGTAPLLSGTLLSRPWLKQLNAQCEWGLTQVWEPLRARHYEYEQTHVKNDLGIDPQNQSASWQRQAEVHALEEAWRLLLLNHPHDDICGCSVDAVHQEDEARFQRILNLIDTWTSWHRRNLARLRQIPTLLPIEIPPSPQIHLRFEEKAPPKHPLSLVEQEQTLIEDWQDDITQVPLSHRHERRYTSTQQADCAALSSLDKRQAVDDLERFLPRLSLESFQDAGDSYNSAPMPDTLQRFSLAFNIDDTALSATATTQVGADECQVVVSIQGEGVLEIKVHQQIQTPNQQVNLILNAPAFAATHQRDLHTGFHHAPLSSPSPEHRFASSSVDQHTGEWQAVGQACQGALKWKNTQGACEFLMMAGHYAYEVCGDDLILPLHRGFSHLSGGRLPTRFYPAGPPFQTPQGQGLGRHLTHTLRWIPKALDEAHLAFHRHQVFVRPVYTQAPHSPLKSLVDEILHQAPQALRLSSHQWSASQRCFILRLLNTSDAPLMLDLSPQALWCLDAWQAPLHFEPHKRLSLAARDWACLAFVLE
jgi:hypothetical protein